MAITYTNRTLDPIFQPGARISYGFLSSMPILYSDFIKPQDVASFKVFTSAQQAKVTALLNTVSKYLNVTFVQATNATTADIRFGTMPPRLFTAVYGASKAKANGFTDKQRSWNYYNIIMDGRRGQVPWTDGLWEAGVLHEILHSLGLQHTNTQEANITKLANDRTSIMLYNMDSTIPVAVSPLDLDLQILQKYYGVSRTGFVGDTTYQFVDRDLPNTTDAVISINTRKAIWDPYGRNALDFSSLANEGSRTKGVKVYFAQGPNDISTITVQFKSNKDAVTVISADTNIYGIKGSNGNDDLSGNKFDNTIDGGKGDDILAGGLGNDTYIIKAGEGNDVIEDKDGSVNFLGKVLHGGKRETRDGSFVSADDPGVTYDWSAEGSSRDLVITDTATKQYITIRNFESGQLGITLTDDPKTPTKVAGLEGLNTNDLLGYIGNSIPPATSALRQGQALTSVGQLPEPGPVNIYGNGGNDFILAPDGNGALEGGEGDDYIYAGNGKKLITGGAGDDHIQGNWLFQPRISSDIPTSWNTRYRDWTLNYTATSSMLPFYTITDLGMDIHLRIDEAWYINGTPTTGVENPRLNMVRSEHKASNLSGFFADGGIGRDYVEGADGDDSLMGGLDADTLIGNGGGDQIYGDEGEDKLIGGDGNDTLDGGADVDTLIGDAGNDVLFGGGGNDYLFGGNFDPNRSGSDDDQLYGGSGNDTLDGNGGSDELFGGDGDDLVAESGSGALTDRNMLDGGEGNDTVWAYAGSNSLYGGNGNDYLLVGNSDAGTQALVGDNYLDGGTGDDHLLGSWGKDTLNGGEGTDSLSGAAGDDILSGEAGNDSLDGGGGKDLLDGGDGDDTLFGGEGDDELRGQSGEDRLVGGAGNDLLDGGSGKDGLFGDAGNDTLVGDGEDYIDGGDGDDVLESSGHNTLLGGAGNDSLSSDGNALLDGGEGNDVLSGGDGDNLLGGGGDDTLEAFGSRVALQGGDGSDRYLMAGAIVGATTWSAIQDSSGLNQIVMGASLAELGVGRQGKDLLFNTGHSGFIVQGGLKKGNFRFTTLSGDPVTPTAARLIGATNHVDALQPSTSADPAPAELDLSFKAVMDAAFRTAINFAFDDRDQADDFVGGQAADNVTGSLLADKLDGNSGNDTLSGRAGNDTLIGDLGDDMLYGDEGDDLLDGGLGNDRYAHARGEGHDQISDAGGFDTLSLADISLSEVTLTAIGRDLSIRLNAQDDVLIKGGLDGSVNRFEFASGAVSLGYLLSRLQPGPLRLNGTAAADTLDGSMGGDTLNGAAGDDSLAGYDGDDLYLYARGDGRDLINDQGRAGESNVLAFAANIDRTDIRLKQAGNDLMLSFATNAGDAITIQNYFSVGGSISEIRFSDGLAWNRTAIQQKLIADAATAGNDTILGSAGDDAINGLAGDDVLSGQDGNDTLNGGVGNDTLDGGNGTNVYQFDQGFGQDLLINANGAGQDRVQFGTGLLASQLVLTRPVDSEDLVLGFKDRPDTVRLQSFFNRYASYSHLASVSFADGTSLSTRALHDAYFAGLATDGYDGIQGTDMADTLLGKGGNDYLDGKDGDDLLLGGDGDDYLSGDEGNDTVVGGAGNDNLSGRQGNDLLRVDGGGIDRLNDFQWGDTLALWQGVGLQDLVVRRGYSTYQLDIGHKGSDDVAQLSNYWNYLNPGQILGGVIRTADGTEVTSDMFYGLALRNSAGNDVITNFDSEDRLLQGLAGNDIIQGGRGNDTLEGGSGDDSLSGYGGEDTYVFGRGDGKDSIFNYDTFYPGSSDGTYPALRGTIKLRDLRASDIRIRIQDPSNAANLLLEVVGSGDSLTVSNYFRYIDDPRTAHQYGVATIQFADGVVWGTADIKAAALRYQLGYEKLFEGDASNNQLWGQATRDLLRGFAGDDQLDGGDGNDRLEGGAGNDKYVFRGAWGQDIIDNTGGGTDWLIFTDVARSQFSFRREGMDLMVGVIGDPSRSVRVLNHFSGGEAAIAYIQPSSGYALSAAEIARLIPANTPTSGNDNLNGGAQADSLSGGAGNDTIYGLGGNDTLLGDDGDDRLNGGDGDDTLRGGAGNDQLFGEAGNDLLDGSGGGNDTLTGGQGQDFYIVNNGRETIVELPGEGSDTVLTGVSFALGDNLENLTLVGTSAINGTGNALNNVLTGNAGANRLDGGAGSDTYVLGKGGGADVIRDFDSTANNNDGVQFKDVKSTDISAVQKVGANLVLKYGTDQVTVENYFDAANAPAYRIEQFKFSDNVTWTNAQIQARAVAAKLADTVDAAATLSLSRPPMVACASQTLSVDQQLASLISAMAAFSPMDAASLHQAVPEHERYAPMLAANRLR